MVKGETLMPEGGVEGALDELRKPEHTIGSVIESIKSPQRKNSVEASSLFIAKEVLDVKGYEQEGGGFNEDLLRARAEQTLLPDGSRPTVGMVRDWFEAKKELADAILDGKVNVSRPITQQNKDEAAYYKALNITRQREGADAAESHITDPEENRKIFEEAVGELESEKARDLSLVVENWEDLVRERAHQLSKVREGKQLQTQDLNDFLKERAVKEESVTTVPEEESQPVVGSAEPARGGPQPPVETGEEPAASTEEAVTEGPKKPEQAIANQALSDQLARAKDGLVRLKQGLAAAGVEPTLEQQALMERLQAGIDRLQQQLGLAPEESAPEARVEASEKETEEEKKEKETDEEEKGEEEKKEEKKQGFFGKAGGFIKNWWKSVSPQGRNKLYWGLGVGVGAAETVFGRGFLTPILGPAASWAVSGVNALVLNGFNYRVQRGITEAKANQDLEKIQKLEAQYKKAADFFAGVAAGSIGGAVGDALWNGLVAPRLPQIQAEATSSPVMGPTASPPSEVPQTSVPATEKVVSPEATKYVVKSGDTLTDILFNKGHEPYGKSLTEIIVKNADVLRERALNDAQRQAIDQLVANPNWTAIDDEKKWKTIMRAGHWIFPGQQLILPVKP